MTPQSILDMINDATQNAYILTTLEYIKAKCKSNTEYCKDCPFYLDMSGQLDCFFNNHYHEGTVPEEWDLKALERRLNDESSKLQNVHKRL